MRVLHSYKDPCKSRPGFMGRHPPLWYGSFGKVGRRIDGGELQRAISGIADIVPCSRRDKNAIACFQARLEIQRLFTGSHADKCPPALYPNKLIGIRVHLQANFAAGGNAHQGHLQTGPCPKRCAEILIFLCRTHDMGSKGRRSMVGHGSTPAVSPGRMKLHMICFF